MSWIALTAAFLIGSIIGAPIIQLIGSASMSFYRCLRLSFKDTWRAPWRLKHKQAWKSFKWAAYWEFVIGARVGK